VRHEHEVSSLKPQVMESKMVDVQKDSLGSNAVSVVLDIDVSTQHIHLIYAGVLLPVIGCLVKLTNTYTNVLYILPCSRGNSTL